MRFFITLSLFFLTNLDSSGASSANIQGSAEVKNGSQTTISIDAVALTIEPNSLPLKTKVNLLATQDSSIEKEFGQGPDDMNRSCVLKFFPFQIKLRIFKGTPRKPLNFAVNVPKPFRPEKNQKLLVTVYRESGSEEEDHYGYDPVISRWDPMTNRLSFATPTENSIYIEKIDNHSEYNELTVVLAIIKTTCESGR
jgi:hypothetical protein